MNHKEQLIHQVYDTCSKNIAQCLTATHIKGMRSQATNISLIFTVTIANCCCHSLVICLFIFSERASLSYGLLWFL